jgi:hypothetical protein
MSRRRGWGGDEDDAIDAVLCHDLQVFGFKGHIVIGVANHQRHARCLCRVFSATGHGVKEWIRHIGVDEGEQPAARLPQAASDGVGDIVQFVGGADDALSRFRANNASIAKDAGNGDCTDAGHPGHVLDGGHENSDSSPLREGSCAATLPQTSVSSLHTARSQETCPTRGFLLGVRLAGAMCEEDEQ